jgi:hypothetical protein
MHVKNSLASQWQSYAQKQIRADSQIVPESRGNSHAWLRVLRHPSPLWPTGGQEK